MIPESFEALVVSETGEKTFAREIVRRRVEDLPAGEVLVEVHYSSLNYKDALSASGNRGVTKKYPHTPGIDAAGVVAQSESDAFQAGDNVIVTSYDLGMNTAGGFGQYIRVPADWVVPLPAGLSLKESMIYGTAGFTAALSVFVLVENGITPGHGDILVSGATGGVGGISVSLLSQLGYAVTAVNGMTDASEYLQRIGAQQVIDIEAAVDTSKRPILPGQWAAGIDAVGGDLLATTIKSTMPNGVVACCGNVASGELPLNVYPFILRGVKLIGIDSQNCPMNIRRKIWDKIAGPWKVKRLEEITDEIPMEKLNICIDAMLERKHNGRTIVRLSK